MFPLKYSLCKLFSVTHAFSLSCPTFDVDEAIEEANGLEREKVRQILHAHFERISVIQFEVCVHRQAQVLLNLLTQLV